MTGDLHEKLKALKASESEGPRPRKSLPTWPIPSHPDKEKKDYEAYGGSGKAPSAPFDKEAMKEQLVAALKLIYDPEIPLNIYDLGLIYGMEIDDEANVEITMTLTAPGCPVADFLVQEVATKSGDVPGVNKSHVTITWEPAWTKDNMTEEALLELGLI